MRNDAKGCRRNEDHAGLIVSVLALDIGDAQFMMDDVEATCGFVGARVRDAIGIMETAEGDYTRRLRDSIRLMATELGQ